MWEREKRREGRERKGGEGGFKTRGMREKRAGKEVKCKESMEGRERAEK